MSEVELGGKKRGNKWRKRDRIGRGGKQDRGSEVSRRNSGAESQRTGSTAITGGMNRIRDAQEARTGGVQISQWVVGLEMITGRKN